MKKPEIPQALSTAIALMLDQYFPGLTAARLESALAFKLEGGKAETLLSRREAAAALRISLPTTDRMLQAKELTRVNVRGRVFIRRSEIDRIVSGEKRAVQE
jgi:excisionase family DNA binding protein